MKGRDLVPQGPRWSSCFRYGVTTATPSHHSRVGRGSGGSRVYSDAGFDYPGGGFGHRSPNRWSKPRRGGIIRVGQRGEPWAACCWLTTTRTWFWRRSIMSSAAHNTGLMWPEPARTGSVASSSSRRTWSCSISASPISRAWMSTSRIRQIDARIPVLFITAATTADHAIEAMKQGAYDYLIKPLDTQHLRRVVGQALELSRLSREPAVVAESPPEEERGDSIIGCCPSMLEVFKAIGRVAAQDVTVLITGESGTGKELVARAIYQHGARAKEPFLAINCAAIPDALLESELFGHEKGAFTGAERRRIGKFEQCSGGTLFLDEVGDMPLATQGKVLRLLQDQAFERVGGNETIQTDVRLIAATNRDLEEEAARGKYRPDLYYRLSVFTIHLPPCANGATTCPCWSTTICGASTGNWAARSAK